MARKQDSPGRYVKTSVPGVYRRNGKYVVRVYDARTGARTDHYPEQNTFDAAKRLKREKESIRSRTGLVYTVREWMGDGGRWLELFPRPKESTMLHNRERVRAFVKEHGDLKLSDVTEEMALEHNRLHGSTTMVVRAAFNDAVKARQIDENPFSAVDVKKSQGRRGIVVLTEQEVRKLIQTTHLIFGDYGREVLGPMIAVAAGTGVRPGENLAICREDIDLQAGELHVWRQFNNRLRKLTSTKGTRLDRTVTMLPIALEALKAMPFPDEPVIVDGKPLDLIWRTAREQQFKYATLVYYWPRIRDAFVMGLPESHHLRRRARGEIKGGEFDMHELRHFYGTALARAGCSIFEIEDQMGHHGSDTVRVYVHLASSDVRESVREKIRRAA
jgi:integrase